MTFYEYGLDMNLTFLEFLIIQECGLEGFKVPEAEYFDWIKVLP